MKIKQQLALEAEMIGMGMKRYRSGIIKNREKGLEANSPYGVSMTSEFINPIVEHIEAFLEKSKKKPGAKHRASVFLRDADLDVVAFITAKSIINTISLQKPLTSSALMLAKAIEDQARFTEFEKQNPALWDTLMRDLVRYSSFEKRRSVLIHSSNKADIKWNKWGQKDKLHLGMKLIELFIAATGAAEIVVRQASKADRQAYLQATNETLNWIDEDVSRKELLSPFNLPMVIPPKPWSSPFDGGYYSPGMRRKLIKTTNQNYLEEMTHLAEDSPEVYNALNSMQDTPWRINKDVLKVMQDVWELGWSIGKMPSRAAIPLPPKPSDIKEN